MSKYAKSVYQGLLRKNKVNLLRRSRLSSVAAAMIEFNATRRKYTKFVRFMLSSLQWYDERVGLKGVEAFGMKTKILDSRGRGRDIYAPFEGMVSLLC
jgi:hypothetical protein